MKKSPVIFLLFCTLFSAAAAPVNGQNLKAEEIVARHLDSIGTKAKRGSLKTLMAAGYSDFESKVPVVKGGGKAIVVSNPENLFFVLSFNSREYPFEKIGYFDRKSALPFVNSGMRSFLGTFIAEHQSVLSDGLFGGSMSLRWAFLGDHAASARLKAAGTKKVGDRKAYAVDYFPVGSSPDFTVRLFFDAETFHHVRTEYRRQVVRGNVVFGQANQVANAVIRLTEDFSDFRDFDGLTLPRKYRVLFSSNSNSSSNENVWGIEINQYVFNQPLAADFFKFDP